jgi:DNA-binding transcriptional ArsR family regulator
MVCARALEDDPRGGFQAGDLTEDSGLSEDEITRALLALEGAGYISAAVSRTIGPRLPRVLVNGLPERGRRTVGLWPSGDSADALVTTLLQAAEQAPDEEDRSRLRKAAAALAGLSRDLLVEVSAALVSRQLGA